MFELVAINEQPWVAADDLATALEYARTSNLLDLYRSNKDEFTKSDVLEIFPASRGENTERGRPPKITYFSEDGAVLLCMFARTPVAKQVRKQIRDVFVAWRHGKLVAPAAPQLAKDTVTATVDYSSNTVRLELPFSQLGRLQQVVSEPEPQPAGWLYSDIPAPEPPDMPNLRYDFASSCRGMHGWYSAEELAGVIGCSKETVHKRRNLNRLPPGWHGQYKQGKVWIHIP
ncbi:MAG: BRO family protein [Deinococcota bacterium]